MRTKTFTLVAMTALVALVALGCAPLPPHRSLVSRAAPIRCRRSTSTSTASRSPTATSATASARSCSSTGSTATSPSGRRNIDALAQHNRVVAIDLPGYGRSSKANYHYSMAFFARVVERVIERLELRTRGARRPLDGRADRAHARAPVIPGRPSRWCWWRRPGSRPSTRASAPSCSRSSTRTWSRRRRPRRSGPTSPRRWRARFPSEAEFFFRDRVQIIGGPDFDGFCYAVARSVAAMARGPGARSAARAYACRCSSSSAPTIA